MKTYTYPLIAKFVYRYANIPMTFVLGFYFLVSAVSVRYSAVHILGIIINAALIYFINRFYIRSYKKMPYKIEVDNDKMICTDFTFQRKKVEIYFSDIDKVSGGIFSGSQTKPISVHDGRQDVEIAFSTHLKNFNDLLTHILQRVKKDVYQELLDSMTKMAQDRKDKIKRKK